MSPRRCPAVDDALPARSNRDMNSTKNPTPAKWCLIGGGQMGRALAGGMIDAGVIAARDLALVEPGDASAAWWREHRGEVPRVDLAAAVARSDTVWVAVKPNVVRQVLGDGDACFDDRLIVSIAAGVSLQSLCGWVGHDRVIRVMPNTPSLVGCGASAYCVGDSVTEADRQRVDEALASVGVAVQVSESQMDAVTGLSGSGPAYVFVLIEALADGGVAAGLPRPLAMQLAAATVGGAAQMVMQTGRHPGELKDAVASPGGTTIAALASLEQNGFRHAAIDAVRTAATRSREMS